MGAPRVIGYEFHRVFYADLERHQVLRDGKPLERPLTSKQFDVLVFFLQHSKQVIPRNKVEPLQDAHHLREPVDDYISKIEARLGVEKEECFHTVRKVGYEFTAQVRARFDVEQQEAWTLYEASKIHFNQQTKASLEIALEQGKQARLKNPTRLPESHIKSAYSAID